MRERGNVFPLPFFFSLSFSFTRECIRDSEIMPKRESDGEMISSVFLLCLFHRFFFLDLCIVSKKKKIRR